MSHSEFGPTLWSRKSDVSRRLMFKFRHLAHIVLKCRGPTFSAIIGRGSVFLIQNRVCGFEDCIGIKRNAVDALFDQEPCKFWIIARRLAADADLASPCAAGRDHLSDHLFDRRISFVKKRGNEFAIAVHSQD